MRKGYIVTVDFFMDESTVENYGTTEKTMVEIEKCIRTLVEHHKIPQCAEEIRVKSVGLKIIR